MTLRCLIVKHAASVNLAGDAQTGCSRGKTCPFAYLAQHELDKHTLLTLLHHWRTLPSRHPCRCPGEEEEEGYSDEYTLEDLDIGACDYVKQEAVPDFRSAWEEMDESTEMADSYGLGQRDSMQEAVEAVIAILGMQVLSAPVTVLESEMHSLCFASVGMITLAGSGTHLAKQVHRLQECSVDVTPACHLGLRYGYRIQGVMEEAARSVRVA